MREVNRNSVQVPQRLSDLYTEDQVYNSEKVAVANSGKINAGIYRHVSVKIALESLYKNICFLCQKDISGNYDIEHFLPWSTHFPERAYDWNNLHQSCRACNQRKKRQDYKALDPNDKKKVDDILLLDPTVDNVNALITFDADSCEALVTDSTVLKANLTANFLNQIECTHARMSHWKRINSIFISDEWLDTFRALKGEYRNFQGRELDFNIESESKIGRLCYNIVSGYFGITKAYNRFVLQTFQAHTGVSIALLIAYAGQYSAQYNLALPELAL